VILLTGHWLSLVGAALVTTAVLTWVFLFGAARDNENPYLGILLYLFVPAVFFAGLVLIPVGAWLSKKRITSGLARDQSGSRDAWKRLLAFLGATTLANVLLGTQFTYRAVEHMESVAFCGQSCHVMQPEFRAAQVAGHSRVACVRCHVAPGAAGWMEAKLAGTRQLLEVFLDSHPRPIPSALETDRLVAAEQTCERCHARRRMIGTRLRVIPKYAEDEKNTVSYTVLLLVIGGGAGRGIHGAHLDPNIEIRYTTSDRKRQEIPWVEWRNKSTGETRTYASTSGAKQGPEFPMQCVDCHNRAAHSFETAERAVDHALALGDIPVNLPFIKKWSLALVTASYVSQVEGIHAIRAALASQFPDRRQEAELAATAVASIYERNVFPDLRVEWGTYPNNAGHTAYPGCFRCHDGAHSAKDGKSISQDCASCHEVLAVDEPDPEILKKLSLAERLVSLQKH
jgi:nitrate/TMAO reductase-like tetraheme cytochrome c subunit